jgi:hypothetical protein
MGSCQSIKSLMSGLLRAAATEEEAFVKWAVIRLWICNQVWSPPSNQRQSPLPLAISNISQFPNSHAFCASRQPSSLLPNIK